jgi:hypothetical protein
MQSWEQLGEIRQFPNVQNLTFDFFDSRYRLLIDFSVVLAINRLLILILITLNKHRNQYFQMISLKFRAKYVIC